MPLLVDSLVEGEKLNNRKLENENNSQLIKRHQSSDYIRCLIGPSMQGKSGGEV